jgi:hypothetical protein
MEKQREELKDQKKEYKERTKEELLKLRKEMMKKPDFIKQNTNESPQKPQSSKNEDFGQADEKLELMHRLALGIKPKVKKIY